MIARENDLSAPATLDYALCDHSRRRRIVRACVCALAAAIAIAVVQQRDALHRQWWNMQASFWRDRCAGHLESDQQIVFEEDPIRAEQLLRSHEFTICGSGFDAGSARRPIRALDRYCAVPSASAFKSYYASLLAGGVVLFCHELQQADGSKAIVVVIYEQTRDAGGRRRSWFRVLICNRKNFLDDLTPQTWEEFKFRDETKPTSAPSTQPNRAVRFFAGQVVKDDPHSCQFSYQIGGDWGRMKFTLQSNDVMQQTHEGPLPP